MKIRDQRLYLERGDLLEAVTSGWQHATIAGHIGSRKVIVVGRRYAAIKHPHTGVMQQVSISRITDLHQEEVVA